MKLPFYYEVTIMLVGGHTIKVKCKAYIITKSTVKGEGFNEYKFTGMKGNAYHDFDISLAQMVGWTSRIRFGFM